MCHIPTPRQYYPNHCPYNPSHCHLSKHRQPYFFLDQTIFARFQKLQLIVFEYNRDAPDAWEADQDSEDELDLVQEQVKKEEHSAWHEKEAYGLRKLQVGLLLLLLGHIFENQERWGFYGDGYNSNGDKEENQEV